MSSVEDLGTTANNAVFTPATNLETDSQSDEDNVGDEEDNDDSDNVEQTKTEQNETTVNELLQKNKPLAKAMRCITVEVTGMSCCDVFPHVYRSRFKKIEF